ncbi:aminotransferase class IV [Hyphomonas jannaschiana]|uniref:aminotransferase class IV n=1 Tax=Hyphomonas jannaschiana TaxID=86 RepID=UPI0035C77D46
MPLILLNQSISSVDTVRPFDLTDRGLLLGDGVFDTSLVVDGHVVLRRRHIRRLMEACDAFGLDVAEGAIEVLTDKAVPEGATGALRVTVTRGPGARGLAGTTATTPTVLTSFTPQALNYPPPPVRLGVSAIHRNPTAPSALYKTLSYGDAIMGHRRALEAGFDDALFVTPDGRVSCSSVANIWARFGSALVTPPRGDGVVAGVMRNWILEHAAQAGYEVSERSLRLEDLRDADGVFLTNSLRLLVPVRAIDDLDFASELPAKLVGRVDDLLTQAARTREA